MAVAAVLRFTWALTVDSGTPPFSDPQWYFATAKNLADGRGFTIIKGPFGTVPGEGGFETLRWPVGYSLTLGAFFKVFDATLTTGRVVNALAGAATVPIVFLLARRLVDARVGLIAAALMAVYPAHIIWSSVLYSDVLFTLPFAAALAVVATAPVPARPPHALAAGMLIGYASIIRPTALVLVIAVLLYWMMRSQDRRAVLRATTAVFAGVMLFAAPVSVWNSARSGEPKLLSENMGYNLRVGHAPYATGRYITPEDLWATVNTNIEPSALPSESLAIRRAAGYAIAHPVREIELSAKKVFYLYTTDSDSIVWASTFGQTPVWGSMRTTDRIGDLANLSSYIVIVLAAASLPRTLTLRREMLLAWLTLVLWTATHIVFFGEPRYRLPILPILLTFVAVALVEIAELVRGMFSPATTAPVSAPDSASRGGRKSERERAENELLRPANHGQSATLLQ